MPRRRPRPRHRDSLRKDTSRSAVRRVLLHLSIGRFHDSCVEPSGRREPSSETRSPALRLVHRMDDMRNRGGGGCPPLLDPPTGIHPPPCRRYSPPHDVARAAWRFGRVRSMGRDPGSGCRCLHRLGPRGVYAQSTHPSPRTRIRTDSTSHGARQAGFVHRAGVRSRQRTQRAGRTHRPSPSVPRRSPSRHDTRGPRTPSSPPDAGTLTHRTEDSASTVGMVMGTQHRWWVRNTAGDRPRCEPSPRVADLGQFPLFGPWTRRCSASIRRSRSRAVSAARRSSSRSSSGTSRSCL